MHREQFLSFSLSLILNIFFVFFSDLRQVPDNQEVFIYANSDVSIVVEILEKVEPQGLEDAVK